MIHFQKMLNKVNYGYWPTRKDKDVNFDNNAEIVFNYELTQLVT